MPYLDIRTTKKVAPAVAEKLQVEIGKIMPTIPGKTVANTLISIGDGFVTFKNGAQVDSVFVDVRMLKVSPEDSKKAFVEKITPIFEEILEVSREHIHLNFTEKENWGIGGEYI